MIEFSPDSDHIELWKPSRAALLTTGAAIIGGWMIGHFVVHYSVWYAVTLALAVAIGLLLANRLEYGVLAYFFVALFSFGQSPGVQSPNSHYKAGLMPSQVILIFYSFIWLGRMLFGRREKIVRNPLNPALFAICAVSILSFAFSNLLRGTRELLFHQLIITQVAEVGLLICSVFAFLISANVLKKRSVIKATFVPIVLVALYVVPQTVAKVDLPIRILWGNFIITAAILLIYGRLLFDHLSKKKQVLFIITLGILLYAAFCRLSWVSGIVATSLGILIVTFFRSKKAAMAMVAVGLFMMFAYPGLYYQVQGESESGGDYDRFAIWHDAYKMFTSVDPLLGVGPGNYHPYVYYHSSIWIGSGSTYTTAHSNYMQTAAETGFLGLAVFLYLIAAGIWAGVLAIRRGPPEMKWVTVGGLAMFIGISAASLMGDYLLPSRGNNGLNSFGTTVYTWLMLGAAVAAGRDTGGEK